MNHSNDNNHNDNAAPEELLRHAAARVDLDLANGETVTIDPDLAAFMGVVEDEDFPEEDATEAHLFPYGRPEDDAEKEGDEA
jgi:hypothetical protein